MSADGFVVAPGALRAAASAARSAVGQCGSVEPGTDLGPVASGMPGSASADAVARVAAGWDAKVETWRARARRYAVGMDSCAQAYQSGDQAVASAFTGIDPNRGRIR